MSVTDPIADYLTRVRNAIRANHRRVDIPATNMNRAISRILLDQKFIHDFLVIDDPVQATLRVYLKYTGDEKSVISGIKRISTPGRRRYVGKDEIPRVRNGLGIAVVSTSQGVMTGKRAKQLGVGGEVLCYVW
jgi:small subunit ribosomal protein S8